MIVPAPRRRALAAPRQLPPESSEGGQAGPNAHIEARIEAGKARARIITTIYCNSFFYGIDPDPTTSYSRYIPPAIFVPVWTEPLWEKMGRREYITLLSGAPLALPAHAEWQESAATSA